MEDIKKMLKMWYFIYEKENNSDVKQAIILDYFDKEPVMMFNIAQWLFAHETSALALKNWICFRNFNETLKGVNEQYNSLSKEDQEKLRMRFMLSVNDAHILTHGTAPYEDENGKGMLLF